MNERPTDFEILRAFVRWGDQAAFTTLVRRHLDLVLGTALRKVADSGAAEEIAQNVFCALARKAWQFASDDSLPAWLHKTALLESKEWLRGELRRRRREQSAAELGTTMNAPDEQTALRALIPILDEGLLALREKDRSALLLRYHERQSLREVGVCLGVGEDAAQKRVASALTKLSEFFQRRGYKTATTTLAAAALEHTASSASAATAAVVIQAALQTGTPSVVGFALLARLASLSKAQLGAACLALALLPVGWQWHQWRDAGQERTRTQAALDSIQAEQLGLDSEIRQLTETAEGLAASAKAISEKVLADREASRQLELWKTRLRTVLTSDTYRWPEDSPFVRIPKSAVREMNLPVPFQPPGVINPEGRELFGLSPQERAALEERLHDHFGEFDRLCEAAIYETNRFSSFSLPNSAIASKVFHLPALGAAAKENNEQLAVEARSILGEQRWSMVEPALMTPGVHPLRRILGFDAVDQDQELAVWIVDNKGALTLGYGWGSNGSISFSTQGALLAALLPDINPDAERSIRADLEQQHLPAALSARLLGWLRSEAEARLRKQNRL